MAILLAVNTWANPLLAKAYHVAEDRVDLLAVHHCQRAVLASARDDHKGSSKGQSHSSLLHHHIPQAGK